MEMATSVANTHEQHFKRSDELYMRLLAVETYLKQFPNGPNAPPDSHVPQGHDISLENINFQILQEHSQQQARLIEDLKTQMQIREAEHQSLNAKVDQLAQALSGLQAGGTGVQNQAQNETPSQVALYVQAMQHQINVLEEKIEKGEFPCPKSKTVQEKLEKHLWELTGEIQELKRLVNEDMPEFAQTQLIPVATT